MPCHITSLFPCSQQCFTITYTQWSGCHFSFNPWNSSCGQPLIHNDFIIWIKYWWHAYISSMTYIIYLPVIMQRYGFNCWIINYEALKPYVCTLSKILLQVLFQIPWSWAWQCKYLCRKKLCLFTWLMLN